MPMPLRGVQLMAPFAITSYPNAFLLRFSQPLHILLIYRNDTYVIFIYLL
jgi:hypothetical protein